MSILPKVFESGSCYCLQLLGAAKAWHADFPTFGLYLIIYFYVELAFLSRLVEEIKKKAPDMRTLIDASAFPF